MAVKKVVRRKRTAAEVEAEVEDDVANGMSQDEEEAPEEAPQVAESKTVKISNCTEAINDVALYDMLGDELSRQICSGGVTWAVHREKLAFAGFGWVEFKTVKAAKAALEFDCMGKRSQEGAKANGDDLFISFYDDERCCERR
eukprot:TRINITY_DN14868_c0_g1_i3.p1 TRINITY_DN14868_c0_g1~~TRINITY_DN14868_c0_g1_i3.p1  ORF type:complete len:168 (+),score=57.12 TRINITY_DN14868_c0_g1_i3:78-506(+)